MQQNIVCQSGGKKNTPLWKLNWRTVELFPVNFQWIFPLNLLQHKSTVIVATSLSFLIKHSKKVRMFFEILYFSQFSWVENLMQKENIICQSGDKKENTVMKT